MLLHYIAIAQQTVIQESTQDLFETEAFGPGKKNFTHIYLGYGLIYDKIGLSNVKLKPWRSNVFDVGIRSLHRFFSFYSWGADFYYQYSNFELLQFNGKIFPDSVNHYSEVLNFHQAGLDLFQRITFYRRGNLMGVFIDLGIYAEYNLLVKYKERDKWDNISNFAKIRTVSYRDLNFVEPYHYGVKARLGYNRLNITAMYRLSNLIKNFDVKMPPIAIEIQFGLHP